MYIHTDHLHTSLMANPYKIETSMHMHTIAPLAEDRDPATQLAKEKQMSTKE